MRKKRILEISMAVLLLAGAFFLSREGAKLVNTKNVKEQERVVVIDAGHGGMDPGKVGVNDSLEKDINLIIARKLKLYLEAEDIKVIMTRDSDNGLYSKNAKNKKVEDMQKRCSLITESMPLVTISIHQNSYHEEGIKGAQVFYYSHSDDGKLLAEFIQRQLVKNLDPQNHREAKANDSYYLLKRTERPTVIVECGFLSNWSEATLLNDEGYQDRIAWAIHLAVLKYINSR